MTTQTNDKVDLQWVGVKDQMAHLVSDLYQKIGFSDVGSSRPQFPIYDLGHPNRGFTTFPNVQTLSGLEECEFDKSNPEILGLKARIGAPTLLEQLHDAISGYLNGDRRLHPEWYGKKLESLKDAITASSGVNIELEMKATVAEKPQYRLERYSIL